MDFLCTLLSFLLWPFLKKAEKRRQKEEIRKEKEEERRKAALEKANARRIAKESMELIEDEQLELMELAAASKGLSSIIHIDLDTLQKLKIKLIPFVSSPSSILHRYGKLAHQLKHKDCLVQQLGDQ